MCGRTAHTFMLVFCRGMKPYRHYLPLDIDYHNLAELVDWAKAHPAEAEAVALRGARYIGEQVRNEDAECYAFRLVVEYNRLRRKGEGGAAAGGNSGSAVSEPSGRKKTVESVLAGVMARAAAAEG